MSPVAELPIHIDSTMRSCYVGCAQKFYREFCLGLRPVAQSIDLHAGGCFANAIERVGRAVHGAGHSNEKALEYAHAGFLQDWGDFEIEKDTPKTLDRTWGAVEDYFDHYGVKTDHIQPHLIEGEPSYEFTFAIPLEPAVEPDIRGYDARAYENAFPSHPSGEPFFYSGRFDRLGEYSTKTIIQDEKTTTSIGAKWAEQWDLRGQFLGYIWAGQHHGIRVDTVAIRGVGILKTKYTQVEAIKTFADWEVQRWHEQLRRDLWAIRRCWDQGYFDYDLADACNSYGGCPFRLLCTSRTPDQWLDKYVVRRWNPLFKNPIADEPLLAA